MATENLKIRVTSDSSQAKRDLGGFDNKLKSTLKSVVSITAALYAAKKAMDFFAKSTKMAMEQEKIFNTLKNTVELTGKSWGEAKWELDMLFASLQETTIYGDTESAAVFQKLTLLTGDYEAALKGLPVALDMAASGIFDLSSSARYVGMALTGNIEMLGRYFSEFKTANNEQLKSMDASEKAAYALDVLKTKLKGLAEGELNTSAGKWANFKLYWGDLREAIGDKFLGTIVNVSNTLLPIVREWTVSMKLHETQINYTSTAYKNMGETAKIAMLEARRETLITARELEKHPGMIQVMWRNTEKLIASVLKSVERSPIAYFMLLKTIEKLGWAAKDFEVAQAKAIDPKKIEAYNDEIEKIDKQLENLKKSADDLKDDEPLIKLPETSAFKSFINLLKDIESIDFTLDIEEPGVGITEFYEKYLKTERERVTEQYLWKLEQLKKYNQFENGVRILGYREYIKAKKQLEDEYEQWLLDHTEEEVEQVSSILENLKMSLESSISGTLYDVFSGEFDSIGELWMSFLKRMAAQYIANMIMTEVISAAFQTKEVAKAEVAGTAIAQAYAPAAAMTSLATMGANAVGAATGMTTTVALARYLAGFSEGGDFIVPQGYPNDSYPILVESGERVQVTPSGQSSRTDELLEKVLNAINSKPVANTIMFDDISMSKYVESGSLKRRKL